MGASASRRRVRFVIIYPQLVTKNPAASRVASRRQRWAVGDSRCRPARGLSRGNPNGRNLGTCAWRYRGPVIISLSGERIPPRERLTRAADLGAVYAGTIIARPCPAASDVSRSALNAAISPDREARDLGTAGRHDAVPHVGPATVSVVAEQRPLDCSDPGDSQWAIDHLEVVRRPGTFTPDARYLDTAPTGPVPGGPRVGLPLDLP